MPPPPPPVAPMVMLPAPFVIVIFEPAVKVVRVKPVPLPMSIAPFAGVEVKPVPPAATPRVEASEVAVIVPLPEVVREAPVPITIAAVEFVAPVIPAKEDCVAMIEPVPEV